MLPIVNPYRDGQLAGVDKHKPKKAPAAGVCSTRTTFLAVLICIVCGTYYLHLNYFASINNKKPSMRGGNTYRSFSDSVKDFAAEAHQDLKKLDDQKHTLDLRKPADSGVPRSGKVVTFGSNNKPEVKKSPIPVAPVSHEVLPKPAPMNQLTPELFDKIQSERDAARGVEPKIVNLAEHVKMLSELPKPKREPPLPPPQEGHKAFGEGAQKQPEQEPEVNNVRDAEHERPEEQPLAMKERQDQHPAVAQVEEPVKEAPNEGQRQGEGHTDQPPGGQQTEVGNAGLKTQAEGGALQAMVAGRLAEGEPAALVRNTEQRVADEIKPAEVPDRQEEPPAVQEGGALQALVATRLTDPVPVAPNLHHFPHFPEAQVNSTVSRKDQLHDLDKAHSEKVGGSVVAEEEEAPQVVAEGDGHAAPPIADPREDPQLALQAEAQAPAEGGVEHPDPPIEAPSVVGIAQRLDPPPVGQQKSEGGAESHPDAAAQQQQQQQPDVVAAVAETHPVVAPEPPVMVTTTANNRPTGYDLPDVQEAPRANPAEGAGEGGDKPKVDYCAGQVDPFAAIPVDAFVPPKGADFELVAQWRSAVRAMVAKVGKVRYGGDELRQLIRSEVDALQIMRFKMFCQYA